MQETRAALESLVIGSLVALILFGIVWSSDHIAIYFKLWSAGNKDYFDIWTWMMGGAASTYYLYYKEIKKGGKP